MPSTRTGAKLILVGDHHQLPEVAAGGGFRAALDVLRDHVVELTVNRRQQATWEQAAFDQLRHGDVVTAFSTYRAQLDSGYLTGGWLDYGYASTVHTAQGVTCDHVLVVGPVGLYREAVYVAMSRARLSAWIYGTTTEALNMADRHATGIPLPGERVLDPEHDLIERIHADIAATACAAELCGSDHDEDCHDRCHRALGAAPVDQRGVPGTTPPGFLVWQTIVMTLAALGPRRRARRPADADETRSSAHPCHQPAPTIRTCATRCCGSVRRPTRRTMSARRSWRRTWRHGASVETR